MTVPSLLIMNMRVVCYTPANNNQGCPLICISCTNHLNCFKLTNRGHSKEYPAVHYFSISGHTQSMKVYKTFTV